MFQLIVWISSKVHDVELFFPKLPVIISCTLMVSPAVRAVLSGSCWACKTWRIMLFFFTLWFCDFVITWSKRPPTASNLLDARCEVRLSLIQKKFLQYVSILVLPSLYMIRILKGSFVLFCIKFVSWLLQKYFLLLLLAMLTDTCIDVKDRKKKIRFKVYMRWRKLIIRQKKWQCVSDFP